MRLDVLRRPAAACLALGSLALLSACGPSGNVTSNTPPPSHPASSPSSGDDAAGDTSTDSTGGITADAQVFSSTLQPPTHDVGTSADVTQDENGITLSVTKAAGGYTYTQLNDFHGIPQDIAIRVHVAMASPASGIYYGIACRGFGQNEQYLLLSDAVGKWVIVQVKSGNQTVLEQGTADGVDATKGVTFDAACVTPKSDDKMNHLVLALNGKVVGTADDSFENVSISNSFELFATSPDATTGTGSVIFNRLAVSSASAP
jgi:hypothetical protein